MGVYRLRLNEKVHSWRGTVGGLIEFFLNIMLQSRTGAVCKKYLQINHQTSRILENEVKGEGNRIFFTVFLFKS